MTKKHLYLQPEGGWTARHYNKIRNNSMFVSGVLVPLAMYILPRVGAVVIAILALIYLDGIRGDMTWIEFLAWSQN